jgi:hypothetical protein
MRSTYFNRIIVPILNGDRKKVIEYLQRVGLLKRSLMCTYCAVEMKMVVHSQKNDGFVWRCCNKKCEFYKTVRSIRSESVLETTRWDLKGFVFSVYLWSIETPERRVCEMTGFSKPTVILIYALLRVVCRKHFEHNPVKLGGEGIICQVDESLFTYEPKYHRGRYPEHPRWVFGIVDTSFTPGLGYMEFVERRDKQTLLPIIERVCRPGTIVYSDGWAAYPTIRERGYGFDWVNHAKNWVSSTGVHTQNVESYWRKQKDKVGRMRGFRREDKQDYLWELLWRERFTNNPYERIVEQMRIYSALLGG